MQQFLYVRQESVYCVHSLPSLWQQQLATEIIRCQRHRKEDVKRQLRQWEMAIRVRKMGRRKCRNGSLADL